MANLFWGKVTPLTSEKMRSSNVPSECPNCDEKMDEFINNDGKTEVCYCQKCKLIYFRYGL